MHRPTAWGPIVAGLAVLLALFVLAAPAAAAAGSVSTGSQVAEDQTTHSFVLDPADAGNLTAVSVDYRSGVDLEDATVSVGVDRDGDGDADEGLATSRVAAGDRGIEASLAEPAAVSAGDAVVVEVARVGNPSEIGSHAAAVGATVDDATARSTVTYRVTPFRSDDTEFRDVSVPGSAFEFTYAADSTFAGATLVEADWRAVSFADAVLTDVRGVDDEWTRVTVEDTAASGVRTERTDFEAVRFSNAAVSDVSAAGDAWNDVTVSDSTLHAVDSRNTAYTDVQLQDARVDGFAAEASTLDGVTVRPASADASDRNVSDVSAGARNGTVEANAAFDGPTVLAEANGAMVDVRGGEAAPNRTVANVTLRESALRNVTVADGALVDVRMRNAALRNVTLENVTIRGVTLSDATYADGTLTDEVITSETELRQELVVSETTARANDGDVDVGASATPGSGNATVDDGGLADGSLDGALD